MAYLGGSRTPLFFFATWSIIVKHYLYIFAHKTPENGVICCTEQIIPFLMSLSEYTREARYQKDTYTASQHIQQPRFKLQNIPLSLEGPFRHYFVMNGYPDLKMTLLLSSEENHYRTLTHYLYHHTGVNLSTQLYERNKPEKRYPITLDAIVKASQFVDVFLSDPQTEPLHPIIT